METPPQHGYHQRYLHVRLGEESQSLPLDSAVSRRFLGGSGMGTHLLLLHAAAGADPLSPAAPLAFVFSPLVGSPLTTSAKFAVVSRSPLTNRINDSLASSGFALAGKRTGHDAIVVTGAAEQPSVLLVDGDHVQLVAADDVWGLPCSETQRVLRERFGSEYQAAVIGPAGERRVRFATISHDGRHAGRGGSGAVMGAKNLKAILVRGERRVTWAQPDELNRLAKELSQRSFGPATAKYRELGTASNLLTFNRLNSLPTRNFQAGTFDGAVNLAPETLSTVKENTRASCAACTIGCEHIYQLGDDARGVRIEYENLFALGPLCGVRDADAVLQASHLCDELGMDTISAGGTIAFAMECADRGLLDEDWLRFDDSNALVRAVEDIAVRRGVGDLLAEGSRLAALSIGHDSIDFAPQVKGLEIPGYEPRALQTMAVGFAVGTRGADHNRSGAYEADFSDQIDRRQVDEQHGRLAVETEDKAALMDSLILCKFLRGVFEDFYAEAAHMLELVTGWDCNAEEMRETAVRIVTARKCFNIQSGWTPAEDTLPQRFLTQALPDDEKATLTADELKVAVQAYHQHRGWSEDGYPTTAQRQALKLPGIS